MLEVGPTREVGIERIAAMVERAREGLAEWPPVTVNLGRILYHPEAVMLGIEPPDALDALREVIRGATKVARDEGFADSPWTPHMTLAYSVAAQSAEPVIAALGRRLPAREITIRAVTLVEQWGPERDWDWRPLVEVGLGRVGGVRGRWVGVGDLGAGVGLCGVLGP